MILPQDGDSSKKTFQSRVELEAQSTVLEPAPPPYDELPPQPDLQNSEQSLEAGRVSKGQEDPRARQETSHGRKRRFLRFLLAAIVLVAAFTLLRSYSRTSVVETVGTKDMRGGNGDVVDDVREVSIDSVHVVL
ncbi:hypothetical protein FB45DRAFT_1052217 [Roridomyces roridus]|uniref:Uncharacterized protein n=1 Tax=Roridomyces roridus TaxID=1738132 RepID=A0AAD7CG86_9AGAR|nr:hypothetical protein FB45DRAFT_1052217 [Roridomyces roridus]